MSTITTIQEFLVSLGFAVDENSAKDTHEQIRKFETRVQGLAVAVYGALSMVANDFEKLYYQTKRIGASSENVRGFTGTIANMGGSADGALSSLENLAQKMRQMPGYEGMLNNLGVNTKDGNGQIRDRVEVLKDLSKTLSGMEYYQANAYGQALGIDENTLMAMRDPEFIANLEKQQKLQKELGMNDSLTAESKEFAQQNRQLWMSVKTISNVALAQMGRGLLPMLKELNGLLAENAPQIKGLIEKYGKGAGLVLAFVAALITIKKAAAVITMLGNLLSVLRMLRLAFLATPFGIIASLGVALVALYKDYQTWKEGGKSLIDWENWQAEVELVKTLLASLGKIFDSLGEKAREFWKMVGGDALIKEATKKVEQAAIAAKPVIDATAREVTAAVQGATDNLVGTSTKGQMTQFFGGNIKGLNADETLAFANKVMSRENKSGRTDVVNKWGYTGKYQFGASALAETGFIDPDKLAKAPKGVKNGSDKTAHKAFLANASNWLKGNWEQYKASAQMQDESFRKLVEKNLDYGANVHDWDKRKMLGFAMAAHLKGAGNAKKWYSKGVDSKDANGTRTSDYAREGERALNAVNIKQATIAFNAPKDFKINQVAPPTPQEMYDRQYGVQQTSQNTVNNSPVTVNQHNTVTVYADNPQEAGKEVGKTQRQVNAELILAAKNLKSPIN